MFFSFPQNRIFSKTTLRECFVLSIGGHSIKEDEELKEEKIQVVLGVLVFSEISTDHRFQLLIPFTWDFTCYYLFDCVDKFQENLYYFLSVMAFVK